MFFQQQLQGRTQYGPRVCVDKVACAAAGRDTPPPFSRRSHSHSHDVTLLNHIEVLTIHSSGKNLSSNAFARYDTPPVPPVPRL